MANSKRKWVEQLLNFIKIADIKSHHFATDVEISKQKVTNKKYHRGNR